MPDEWSGLRSQISSNHRRVISVRLRVLEDLCLRLLGLFQGVNSALAERQPLPAEKAGEIDRLVRELRTKIGQMKTGLGLESEQIDVTREAEALVTAMTIDIEELYPRYLKGYGEVSDGLRLYLEAQLGELLRITQELRQALGKPASRERSGD